jgi:uncharacterized protein
MRIVLDTNVLVSALLRDGSIPAHVVDLWLAGDVDLMVDARISAEYRDVLARPEFGFDADDVQALMDMVDRAEHVVAAPLPLKLTDPTDAPFLEVAVASAADALVTGNVRHFRIGGATLDIPVLTPRAFLDLLAGR